MAEADVEAAGYTSSSAWYRRYVQFGAPEAPLPSPYQQGPDGSGLELVRSGLVLGDPVPGRGITPPAGDWTAVPSVAFDDSADFWSRGPVVSFIGRNALFNLGALLALREADYDKALPQWSAASSAGLWTAIGFRGGPSYDGGTNFNMKIVDPSLHDYIVAVEGCFREDGLERLVALTRTGRRYQLGLAGCTYAFREDAPPGGYLAGLAGRYADWYNTSNWLSNDVWSIRERDWINRLQFVWAAPRGAGQPTYKLAATPSPVTAPSGSGAVCAAEAPLAGRAFPPPGKYTNPCGPIFNSSCPSHLCCGWMLEGPEGLTYPACGFSADACQKTCQAGYGMCSDDAEPVPEENQAVFVASDPTRQRWPPAAYERIGGAAGSTAEGGEDGSGGRTDGDGGDTWVYLVRRDALATYEAAREYCRSSTLMGLSWSLVSAADLMLWTTTKDMRWAVGGVITRQNGFWLDQGSGTGGCLQAMLTLQYQMDQLSKAIFASDCDVLTSVVCKASAAVRNSTRGLAEPPQGGNGAASPWSPGPHVLTLSPVLGGGPRATCRYTLGSVARAEGGGSNATSGAASSGTLISLTQPIARIEVSTADLHFIDGPLASPLQVSGLRIGLGDNLSSSSASSSSNTTAGASSAADVAGSGSTSGWQALELAEGEVVTAVRGCAGGYVESLAFVTSAGRRWTTEFLPISLCSVPFAQEAPPGGYLVGLQGESGTFIHSLQLVWGQPISSLSPPPPLLSPPPQSPPARSPPSPPPQPPSLGAAPSVQPDTAQRPVLPLPTPSLPQSPDGGSVTGSGGGEAAAPGGGGSPSASSSSSSSSPSGGTSVAAVVGGAVGATVGAILLAALALLIRRRRLQREHEAGKARAAAAAAAGKASGGGSKGGGKLTSASSSGRYTQQLSEGSALDTGCVDMELGAANAADYTASDHRGSAAPVRGDPQRALSEQERQFDRRLAAYLEGLKSGLQATSTAETGSGMPSRAAAAAASAGTLTSGTNTSSQQASSQLKGVGDERLTLIARAQAELSSHQENLRIEGLLGQGGFGVVYLGTWRGLRVAVKSIVVHDALIGREGRQRHRAILEAAISKSLEHPNVVMTYAYSLVPLSVLGSQAPSPQAQHSSSSGPDPRFSTASSSDADVYKLLIIQEFCDVGSLGAALRAGVLGGAAAGGAAALCAASLARDLACGMAYIHARNIVHGDLSLGNVLLITSSGSAEPAEAQGAQSGVLRPGLSSGLEAPGCGQLHPHERAPSLARWRAPIVAKVADFGLSLRMTGSQTHASNCFQGTPSHSAPEVLLQGRLSKAADVWSFGVILLELCHGETIQGIRVRAKTAAAPAGQRATAQQADAHLGAGPAGSSKAGQQSMVWPPPWAVPPPGIHPAIAQLITACLSFDSAGRPTFVQAVEVLEEALHEMLDRQGPGRQPPPVRPPLTEQP
ncbi:hypothetical protein HYH03_010204 [Edaphochlamys debaryana]|uniref:Protein kinase domain-containing protein n=1 Tax=Edaphochlamys debaryana TaxID=47281 RepID=A0A835XX06_9CHLO|nr:hypothetical protein HYH03_010204 [Edaphochlamys debaryana]|eukprot:KAG2491415.1 hypothetical protein HYH03_010204 [Edaphochlamys debaryana]